MDWIKLARPKHWIKNLLVFAALVFSGRLTEGAAVLRCLWAALLFCAASSAVYIFNDICDAPADALHEVKRARPIASGRIKPASAGAVCAALTAALIAAAFFAVKSPKLTLLLAAYIAMNVLYSLFLKRIPLLDVCILVAGFLLRLLCGGAVIDQPVSPWLYLTVMALSFFVGLGKRRNELRRLGARAENVRGVLRFYTPEFLDKNMYMCMGAAVVFYALWTVLGRPGGDTHLVWTTPLALVICMKYSLTIERSDWADPVDVLIGDKVMLVLIVIFAVIIAAVLYGGKILGAA
ncbi:MAG: decaprenyl-phosphate phosphoribosyltransferase [Oscillospiraceae bacterium]|nr:decaprenyl-phosphate phosphoribosyltransferase [Oscillospiraceae bacterium]